MKNFKVTLLIVICTFLLGFQKVYSQSEVGEEFITIKTFEPPVGSGEMIVIDNNNNILNYQLGKINPNKYTETFGENITVINKEIQKWISQGFIIHTYSSYSSGNEFYNTIILVKNN